ncbi:NAD(P)-binding protein [Aspergillus undulatus]|uniref:NAD(P)-binding protein n=1 Tax=Aspergillus undulatus TaxID=1810928 RepID=UPI003CCCFB93
MASPSPAMVIDPSWPAATPPPGVVPNFEDPPSRKTTIIVLLAVFVPLMLAVVAARVYVRTRITKIWGAEDIPIQLGRLTSQCGSITHMALYTQTLPMGLGRHMWDVRAIDLIDPSSNRKLSAGGISFPWTLCFAKISILLLYKRIFPLRREVIASWIGIVADAVMYAFCISIAIGSIVKCAELGDGNDSYCRFNSGPMVIIVSVVNVTTDFYVLILPIPRLAKLQVSQRRKIGLLLVFASGLGACAASLARLVNFSIHYHSTDTFWIQGRNAEFSIVEMNVAIIVACATSLPMFFTQLRSLGSSFYSSAALSINMSGLSPVLITGGNGFIAYHIISKLLAEDPNCIIHCIDVNTARNIHNSDTVTYHKGDLSSVADVEHVMSLARPVTIFHTASPEFSDAPEAAYREIIVDGTHHVLNTATKIGTVKALINTSTSGVINDNHTDLINGTEEMPILHYPDQKRLYCLAKADAEEAIQAANRKMGFLTTSLRPCLAFGERDTNSMGKMVAVALAGRSRFQMGPGKNAYDFVYVGNLADAHLLAAHALVSAHGNAPLPAPQRVEGEVFNITNGDPWRFWDFQREISKQLGRPIEKKDIVVIPKWVGLVMGFVSEWIVWAVSGGSRVANSTREGIRFSTLERTLNGEKARRVLGYEAKVGMQEGIERAVIWFRENPDAIPPRWHTETHSTGGTKEPRR